MSNTESLRRTDLLEEVRRALPVSRIATLLAVAIFAALLISFRPFTPAAQGGADGDIVNQAGYGSVALLSLFGLFAFVDRRVLGALLSPWWLLLIGMLFFGITQAYSPPHAQRAVMFTLVGMIGICAVLTLPKGADSFSRAVAWTGLIVVGYCYLGLAIHPDVAVHEAGGAEPQHAGSWRGLYAHKNIAGPVMACLSFAGLYLFRRNWRFAGTILFISAFFFLLQTNSKTTAGLAPFAILCVLGPSILGLRGLTALALVLSVAFTALFTVGIVFIEPVGRLVLSYFPDLTYTGRTALWDFAGGMILRSPWTGYGLESFWATPIVLNEPHPFDRAWDVRNMVHGHNGYIDVALSIGLVGLAVAVIAFVLAPARDYLRTPLKRENVLLADFFMMIVIFTVLNAFLESFFFRRADPVWLLFVFGALGLRLTARFPVRA